MSNAPFPINPALTGIVIAYRNNRLIADNVLPRVQVGKQEFRWLKHNLADGFNVPDTKVGRKSSPNQVEFSATEQAGFTVDFGLDDVIPQNDVMNQDFRFDPIANAALRLTDMIALDREVRVANAMQNAANYAGSVTLGAGSYWTDAGVSPLDNILTKMDTMVVRPNNAFIGREAFTKLRQNSLVVQAIRAAGYGGADKAAGIVTAEQIAQVLELDNLYVGEAFLNTAAKGQAPSLGRVWGKNFGMWYAEPLATNTQGMSFGFTAQFGSKVAGEMPVTEGAGLRGGTKVRVGESVSEIIAAADLGYLFKAVIA